MIIESDSRCTGVHSIRRLSIRWVRPPPRTSPERLSDQRNAAKRISQITDEHTSAKHRRPPFNVPPFRSNFPATLVRSLFATRAGASGRGNSRLLFRHRCRVPFRCRRRLACSRKRTGEQVDDKQPYPLTVFHARDSPRRTNRARLEDSWTRKTAVFEYRYGL